MHGRNWAPRLCASAALVPGPLFGLMIATQLEPQFAWLKRGLALVYVHLVQNRSPGSRALLDLPKCLGYKTTSKRPFLILDGHWGAVCLHKEGVHFTFAPFLPFLRSRRTRPYKTCQNRPIYRTSELPLINARCAGRLEDRHFSDLENGGKAGPRVYQCGGLMISKWTGTKKRLSRL
jgi:hypothetical protein